jgi:decaprenylphospho-beta-D-ribofuranose 2-oxidase
MGGESISNRRQGTGEEEKAEYPAPSMTPPVSSQRRLLAGWGRTAPTASDVVPLDPESATACLTAPPDRGVLARGLGRCYGDAAQNSGGTVLDGTALAGPIEVDVDAGTARVGGGVSLDELIRRLVPLGLWVPVTPGTRFVTIGGALAADVHGKNHHCDGSFAGHTRSLTLATPTGTRRLTPDDDLFWATAGGMGLTGVILEAELTLPRIETSTVLVDTDRTTDLDGVLALMDEGDHRYHYSVAWIDCLVRGRHLGRSILTRGDFAGFDDLGVAPRAHPLAYDPAVRVHAPPVFPPGLVNAWTMRLFNEAWYRKAPVRRRGEPQTIPAFFHPLDAVGGWNRVYGPRGFLQYQFVVPFGEEPALQTAVERLATAGMASALAVLKRFGPGDPGPLSFPAQGWTLALDLPVVAGLAPLLDELDELVASAGGRVYLAKDSRLRPELVPVMYPRLAEWRAVRDRADPDGVLVSDLDRRIDVTGRR